MENKKKKIIILVVSIIVVLVTIIILFITGVFKFGNVSSTNSNNNGDKNTSNSVSVDDVEMNITSFDIAAASEDSVNSIGFYIYGDMKISYDESKYAGVALSGYCLGSENETYKLHGPGSGHVLFHNGDTKLLLELDYPQEIKLSNGTTKMLSEIDWSNVKIKYCKIDKMSAVPNGDANTKNIGLNFEKYFD